MKIILNPQLADEVLAYLNVTRQPSSLEALQTLLDAYIRRVPWESVSRIVRYSEKTSPETRSRWPDKFWRSAIDHGTGGTCFESNYAFAALLTQLGYTGYLTVNNMMESIGCHTAIIVEMNAQKYLADVGLPVHCLLPLHPNEKTTQASSFHTYTATPQGDGTYLIERDNHPKPYCFTLIDTPIPDDDYRDALTNDYREDGLFLDRVIVVRVVDEVIWRFSGDGKPYQLESFPQEGVTYYYLGDDLDQVAAQVAAKFDMNADLVTQALHLRPERV